MRSIHFFIAVSVFAASTIAQSHCSAADFSSYVSTPMDYSGLAWYEQGLNPGNPTAGLPRAGIINGVSNPASTFLLQPYNQNNVLLLSRFNQFDPNNNVPPPPQLAGVITFQSPTPARSLAFATSAEFGGTIAITVHYSDGAPDTIDTVRTNSWIPMDQFPLDTVALGGRLSVQPPASGPQFLDSPTPSIWETDIQLPYSAIHPVGAVDVALSSGVDGPIAIFGVSASTDLVGPFTAVPLAASSFNQDIVVESSASVPEPGMMAFTSIAALASLLPRRRRAI